MKACDWLNAGHLIQIKASDWLKPGHMMLMKTSDQANPLTILKTCVSRSDLSIIVQQIRTGAVLYR